MVIQCGGGQGFKPRPTSHPGPDSFVYTGFRRFLALKRDGKWWLHRFLTPTGLPFKVGPFESLEEIIGWLETQGLHNRKV